MFLRLMDYEAVFGVTDALLDGLDDARMPAAPTCSPASGCSARIPGAYERLVDAGLTPVRFALCGPALAIGREPGGPAFVPEGEWELTGAAAETGRVCITSTPRARAGVRVARRRRSAA